MKVYGGFIAANRHSRPRPLPLPEKPIGVPSATLCTYLGENVDDARHGTYRFERSPT
jgi:hypothetical protein